MSAVSPTAAECPNRLLAALPEPEYQALRPHLEYLVTPIRFIVFERDKPITHVYFPLEGAHSVLAIMEDGAAVEVGTVGNEGFTTVDVLTGADSAIETTIVQVPGSSLRLPIEQFHAAAAEGSALHRLLTRYLQVYLAQVSQSVACNRLHSIEQRFARWVLMSHDRVHGDRFQLTQEFLADMLGVYRPSVSLVARTFQQAGLIQYQRGVMTILDRGGLEEAVCECYSVVRQRYEKTFGKP
ncbi:MAG TPA: Crp/Fnr family transcriptional regulator [Noviherbaspirillum sp.]|nr:Crp/Fnr family transcriptional regulator [Noviherbaspirillum sp.]